VEVAAVLILGLVFSAMALSGVIIGIGLVRSRHHMTWKTPGRNMYTGKWSDEPEPDDEKGRERASLMPLSAYTCR
jgi:hypothetical protein